MPKQAKPKLKSPEKKIDMPKTQEKRAETTKAVLSSIENRQTTDSNN